MIKFEWENSHAYHEIDYSILHQKFIGKSNVIKLKIPSRTIDNSRFKLFNYNQNKKFYKYLGHSVSNYLDSITNSLNFDIKDSFKSHNNSSINRNKDKSNDKIMKNYFVVKNSFNNLYNIEKIKSDFNEVNNTLNKDEKIKKMKHLYYTPFLVRKAIKKNKMNIFYWFKLVNYLAIFIYYLKV